MSSVANYNIEDNSGANVRIDLNAVFAAIQSNNSESSDLATSKCVAGMTFLNTTSNELKVRNSSNGSFTTIGNIDQPNLGLLSKSGGTMTGQFLADDSNSAAAPAISFDTDTDLGLFRKTNNIMGFSSAGTEQMVFDANGLTLRTQNEIRFGDNDSSHYVGLKADTTIGTSFTLTLPTEDGSSGQFLKTNGSGVLSFASSTGSITVGSTAISLGGSATTISGLSTVNTTNSNTTTTKATQYRSNSSSGPAFQNSSGTETAAGRLVRMSVNFDSFQGGSATDNFTSIRRSFNVSSITDNSEGNFTINFSTSLPSGATTAGMIDLDRFTFNDHCTLYLENTSGAGTGSVRVRICSSANSGHVLDKNSVNVVCFA